jgi:hypothetical protein
MSLVTVKDIIGREMQVPDWHPRAILQAHNDALAKRREWKNVRAYSPHDLERWNLSQHWEDHKSNADITRIIQRVTLRRQAPAYMVFNSTATTTAAPVKQPTGTAIRTMIQVRTALSVNARIIAWGCSFDGSAAATPGQVELFENTAAATMTTAFAAGDFQPYYPSNGTANTAGATGVPFNLSTATSGFATTSVTEGTAAAYRAADLVMLPPTGPYVYQFPLGREFELVPQNYLRCRVTFGTTVNMYVWIIIET